MKAKVLHCAVYGDITIFNIFSTHKNLPINIIIDTEDIINVSKYHWHYMESGIGKTPKIRMSGGGQLSLSQFVLNASSYARIEHKNGNIFDFRKSNLKIESA